MVCVCVCVCACVCVRVRVRVRVRVCVIDTVNLYCTCMMKGLALDGPTQ